LKKKRKKTFKKFFTTAKKNIIFPCHNKELPRQRRYLLHKACLYLDIHIPVHYLGQRRRSPTAAQRWRAIETTAFFCFLMMSGDWFWFFDFFRVVDARYYFDDLLILRSFIDCYGYLKL
jgi:hypothetical protein